MARQSSLLSSAGRTTGRVRLGVEERPAHVGRRGKALRTRRVWHGVDRVSMRGGACGCCLRQLPDSQTALVASNSRQSYLAEPQSPRNWWRELSGFGPANAPLTLPRPSETSTGAGRCSGRSGHRLTRSSDERPYAPDPTQSNCRVRRTRPLRYAPTPAVAGCGPASQPAGRIDRLQMDDPPEGNRSP